MQICINYNRNENIIEYFCREYFVQTIQTAIELRPLAKWGYYGFPYCNYNAGASETDECSESFAEHNQR
jgi:hyaluronoglucosaminidase